MRQRGPSHYKTVGKRGGEGPNKGKKKKFYAGIAPDGSKLKAGTFNHDAPTIKMYIYCHEGRWHAAGIWPEPAFEARGLGRWVEAQRVR